MKRVVNISLCLKKNKKKSGGKFKLPLFSFSLLVSHTELFTVQHPLELHDSQLNVYYCANWRMYSDCQRTNVSRKLPENQVTVKKPTGAARELQFQENYRELHQLLQELQWRPIKAAGACWRATVLPRRLQRLHKTNSGSWKTYSGCQRTTWLLG